MNKRNILIPVIIVVIVVASVYFVVWKTVANQLSSTTPVSVSQSEWKMYANTAYHYSVKYPQTWHVGQVLEEDRKTVEKSRMIELSYARQGGKGYVGITTWDLSEFNGTDQASVEFRQSMSIDLKSFAEAARQKKISEKNNILPDKKVGELQDVVFADQKAFSYIVTGSYDKYGGDNANYLFLENKGIKFMIYHSLDTGLPKEIANTFEFTNSSTTVPIGN